MHLPYKAKKLDLEIDHERINHYLKKHLPSKWQWHGFHNTGHNINQLLSSGGELYLPNGKPNNSLLPPFLPVKGIVLDSYLENLIYSFCPQPGRTRFTEVKAGGRIAAHRDLHPNWYNKVRVHIPIVTHHDCVFNVWDLDDELQPHDKHTFHMGEGEAWVFDTWRVHSVENNSSVDRVHLILDLEPRGKLFELMFKGEDYTEVFRCLGYKYPDQYFTDSDTMEWLTGGDIESGIRLWKAKLVENNPQIGRYKLTKELELN